MHPDSTALSYIVAVRVAVIGAGAAGLCCARELLGAGLEPVILERAPVIGGAWVYREHAGPMYGSLRTNLPVDVMAFRDVPFPDATPRFPGHAAVLAYLEAFADAFDLRRHLRLRTPVTAVRRDDPWRVDGERFDAVAVCSGHYAVPRIPTLPGDAATAVARSHSLDYRGPEPFAAQRVVLLGAKASGIDLGLEIETRARAVFLCSRDHQRSEPLHGNLRREPNVVGFAGERDVMLADGRTLADIDAFVYCTGYRYRFDFLEEGIVDLDDNWVHPLRLDLFTERAPTLGFIGLPYQVVPFPLIEAQSRVFAHVLAGTIPLPAPAQIHDEKEVARRHMLRYGDAQFAYVNALLKLTGSPLLPPHVEREYRRTQQTRRERPHDYRDVLAFARPEDVD